MNYNRSYVFMQPCTFDYKQGSTFERSFNYKMSATTTTAMLCNATPSRTAAVGNT